MPHDPHFHDCPNVIAGKPCGGKASIPDGQGRDVSQPRTTDGEHGRRI